MPIDYSEYPSNWKTEIRPAILARAKNCCENCGLQNYSIAYSYKSFIAGARRWEETFDQAFKNSVKSGNDEYEAYDSIKKVKVILTIAHLDHIVTNNDFKNLKALCQICHLEYDKNHHQKNRRKTNNLKKGLQNLFEN